MTIAQSFPCTSCGLCCQNIASVKELEEYDLGDGVCRFFDSKTKSCSIYENRPNICKIDFMYENKYYKEFSKQRFYELNAQICNKLQDNCKFDISYRIKLKG